MSALVEVLAKFAIDIEDLKKAQKEGSKAVGGLTDKLKSFGTMLAGGVILNGIKNMVTGLVDQGSALNDASNQLGISTDALQQWGFAAKLNGVEAGELNKSFLVLQKNMAKAAENGAKTGGPFQKLGVTLRGAGGEMRETTDVLRDTGLAIARLKSPAERTQAAMEVFGKAGAKLNPLFADGEEGLKKYLSEIDKLGGGLSKDAIASLDDMGDQMDRFDMVTTSAKAKLVQAFLPTLTRLVGGLTDTLGAFMKTKEGAATLQAGVVALGVAAAAAGVAMLAPWLPVITAITFVGLLVQDFIVGLNGGESLIGRIFDKLFGEGSGASFFAKVKDDAQALFNAAKDLYDFIKGKREDNTAASTEANSVLSQNASKRQMAGAANSDTMLTANKLAEMFGFSGGDAVIKGWAETILRERDQRESDRTGTSLRKRYYNISDEDIGGYSVPIGDGNYRSGREQRDIDRADLASVMADLASGIPKELAGAMTSYGGGMRGEGDDYKYVQPSIFQPNAPMTEGGRGASAGDNVSQSLVVNTNITVDSDDPGAIADAANGSLGAQLRAAGDNFRKGKK